MFGRLRRRTGRGVGHKGASPGDPGGGSHSGCKIKLRDKARFHCGGGKANLCQLRAGATATVAGLGCADGRVLRKLLSMGVMPGSRVKVIQVSPCRVIEIGYTTLALDDDMARQILVD